MPFIELTNSSELVEVDEIDFEYLSQWEWCLNGRGYTITYVVIDRIILLHHEVIKRMGLTITDEVDHKDRNKFNCKRENLRLATRSQNMANKGPQTNNTSGYKGVSFNKKLYKWTVSIKVRKTFIYLGCYKTPEEAALAYNKASKHYFGEFAFQNLIE